MYAVCQKKWELGNRGTLEVTLRRYRKRSRNFSYKSSLLLSDTFSKMFLRGITSFGK